MPTRPSSPLLTCSGPSSATFRPGVQAWTHELGRVSHVFSTIYAGPLKIIFDSMKIFASLFVFELQNSFHISIKDENHLPVWFTERERGGGEGGAQEREGWRCAAAW